MRVGMRSAAVQAGGFACLLFVFSQGVDAYFDKQALPDQYTAHNITVAIRTIVRGLSYLLTFIFAANAVGLSGARTPCCILPLVWLAACPYLLTFIVRR